MPLGLEVGLGQGDFVLDGDPIPHKRGAHTHFSAVVYCGQTAVCVRIPLGTEVGLGPGDIVLDAHPAHPSKSGTALQFSAHVYCRETDRCIKMPLGTEIGLVPGDIVLDGAQPLPQKGEGGSISPILTMPIVAKRSLISATAELLYLVSLYLYKNA